MSAPMNFPAEAELRQSFGERLTLSLEALQIRPSNAAELLGISQARLTHWTKGRHWPDCYRIALYCALTGVTLDYLLPGKIGGLPSDVAGRIRSATAATDSPP